MARRLTQVLAALAGAACAALMVMAPAGAHETDQYTLPRREFADMGPYLNAWMYDAMDEAVRKVNERIAAAKKANRPMEVERLKEDGEIVRAVNSAFPNAMVVIEGFDSTMGTTSTRDAYPGMVCGYKESLTNIYQHAHFILDPRQLFRIWLAKTSNMYGTYIGGDKVGHFTDMGMNYWRAYDAARRKGANEEEATQAAVDVGTQGLIFSESGMLGYLSAGSYSNGDMAANYLGFVFYRNLTSPMMLKGKLQPAMLVRDGDFWKFAPHVRRDNDFFAVYISDHWCEAINPSRYESGMRDKIREAIKARQADVLERYADENGLRRPAIWYETAARDCATYYGVDYGHRGTMDELLAFSAVCYDPLSAKALPNDRNDRGYTPLHDAAMRGDLARVQALIASGADVNVAIRSKEDYSSEWGATPLHVAARNDQREVVEALLKAGANAKAADDRGATPLHYGVEYPEIETLLLSRGADANARDISGRTALHWAANLGKGESVEAIADRGGDANQADRAGVTPLHLAAARGDSLAVARLIDHGAKVDSTDHFGRTPLHAAAGLNDAETAMVLMSRGAKATVKDAFGVTPLHDAARQGRTAVASALMANGASPASTDLSGITPLHLAARDGHDSTVQAMLTRGANPNARSTAGVTPLHEAAFSGREPVIVALTSAGSDRTAKDALGRTPHDVASTRGHRNVLAMLVASNNTPLHASAAAQ